MTMLRIESAITIQTYHAVTDKRLRINWLPMFVARPEDGGKKRVIPSGKPGLENIPIGKIIAVVQMHNGVIGHAVARRLDRAGWKFEEPPPAEEQEIGATR